MYKSKYICECGLLIDGDEEMIKKHFRDMTHINFIKDNNNKFLIDRYKPVLKKLGESDLDIKNLSRKDKPFRAHLIYDPKNLLVNSYIFSNL